MYWYVRIENINDVTSKKCTEQIKKASRKKHPTRMGFEPTRAEHNGLAVHRLNHSATSSLESK